MDKYSIDNKYILLLWYFCSILNRARFSGTVAADEKAEASERVYLQGDGEDRACPRWTGLPTGGVVDQQMTTAETIPGFAHSSAAAQFRQEDGHTEEHPDQQQARAQGQQGQ